MAKRAFDISIALTLLIIASPFMLIIAVAIRLDSPGPALFKQQRVGTNGRPFSMLKFRSMSANASSKGPYFTNAGDPRITRLGRNLRKLSLDELPQLINVLIGDMSLVGPRPDVPAQREGYTDEDWKNRHKVRPGITGLAQATVRSEATPGERKALDLEYVANVSLRLDLKILLLTAKQVISKGSY